MKKRDMKLTMMSGSEWAQYLKIRQRDDGEAFISGVYRPFRHGWHIVFDIFTSGLWLPFHWLIYINSSFYKYDNEARRKAYSEVVAARPVPGYDPRSNVGPCAICGCDYPAHRNNRHHSYVAARAQ